MHVPRLDGVSITGPHQRAKSFLAFLTARCRDGTINRTEREQIAAFHVLLTLLVDNQCERRESIARIAWLPCSYCTAQCQESTYIGFIGRKLMSGDGESLDMQCGLASHSG